MDEVARTGRWVGLALALAVCVMVGTAMAQGPPVGHPGDDDDGGAVTLQPPVGRLADEDEPVAHGVGGTVAAPTQIADPMDPRQVGRLDEDTRAVADIFLLETISSNSVFTDMYATYRRTVPVDYFRLVVTERMRARVAARRQMLSHAGEAVDWSLLDGRTRRGVVETSAQGTVYVVEQGDKGPRIDWGGLSIDTRRQMYREAGLPADELEMAAAQFRVGDLAGAMERAKAQPDYLSRLIYLRLKELSDAGTAMKVPPAYLHARSPRYRQAMADSRQMPGGVLEAVDRNLRYFVQQGYPMAYDWLSGRDASLAYLASYYKPNGQGFEVTLASRFASVSPPRSKPRLNVEGTPANLLAAGEAYVFSGNPYYRILFCAYIDSYVAAAGDAELFADTPPQQLVPLAEAFILAYALDHRRAEIPQLMAGIRRCARDYVHPTTGELRWELADNSSFPSSFVYLCHLTADTEHPYYQTSVERLLATMREFEFQHFLLKDCLFFEDGHLGEACAVIGAEATALLNSRIVAPLVAEQLPSGAWAQEPPGEQVALRRTRAVQAMWRFDYPKQAEIARRLRDAAAGRGRPSYSTQ